MPLVNGRPLTSTVPVAVPCGGPPGTGPPPETRTGALVRVPASTRYVPAARAASAYVPSAPVRPDATVRHALPLRSWSCTVSPATGCWSQSPTLPATRVPRAAAVTRDAGRFPSRRTPRIACIAFSAFQSLGRMPLITYSPKPILPPAELPDGDRSENLT